MQDIAIIVENVNKVFRIYDHPVDRLKEAFSIKRKKFHTDFQALKGINFTVNKGEFLGIVGRNGAGKSTLLKILSRELTPTSGKVLINGNVSLLQLGVGFDPELTGIDNARFSSKLLGYTDDEVEGMIDDIITFADIGEFIYHPVKTYSSGMYSRLSFAVGININPDILIADEVLSVGDMRFSQKCLRKMREFKEQGKTVIFVSHDIQSVNIFCDNAIWIKEGEIFLQGEAKQVTTDFQNYMLYDKLPEQYSVISNVDNGKTNTIANSSNLQKNHNLLFDFQNIEWSDLKGLSSVGDGRAEINRITFILANTFERINIVQGNEEVILLLDITAKLSMENPQIGFVLYNRQGLPALHSNNDICGAEISSIYNNNKYYAQFRFKLPSLANGNYIFSVGIQTGLNMAHKVDDAFEFIVERIDIKATQCGYSIIENEKFELFVNRAELVNN